jgi:hypothetical protein
VLEPVDGLDAPRLAVADASVVDHRVISTERVRLLGCEPHPCDARQVAHHDVLGCRQPAAGIGGANVVASMQGDRVAALGEQLRRHQPQPVA